MRSRVCRHVNQFAILVLLCTAIPLIVFKAILDANDDPICKTISGVPRQEKLDTSIVGVHGICR